MKLLKPSLIIFAAVVLLFLSAIFTIETVEIPLSNNGLGVAVVDSRSGFPLNIINYNGPEDSNDLNWAKIAFNATYWLSIVFFVFYIASRRFGEDFRD